MIIFRVRLSILKPVLRGGIPESIPKCLNGALPVRAGLLRQCIAAREGCSLIKSPRPYGIDFMINHVTYFHLKFYYPHRNIFPNRTQGSTRACVYKGMLLAITVSRSIYIFFERTIKGELKCRNEHKLYRMEFVK